MAPSPGTFFGRYHIESLLGAGGMGEVYRAQDPKLRRNVAIKFLPAQFTTDKERLRRFETEACAASSLQLSGDAKKRITKRYTDNVEAYQLYLQGRYFWNRRTDENLKKAVELFQTAIDKDPNYALAYAGWLILTRCLEGQYTAPRHRIRRLQERKLQR